MSTSNPTTVHTWRPVVALDWVLVIGSVAMLAWTTLCLGGYLAETMVVTSGLVFGLAVLGVMAWAWSGRSFHLATLVPLPFLFFALASVIWLAPAKWLAWREWLLWFQMWLVFVLVLHFGRRKGPTWLLVGTFLALGLAGVAMAAWQRFSNPSWMMLGREQADQFVGRSAGMFGIPNSLAGLLELMLPGCLVLLFSRAVRPTGKVICAWFGAMFLFAVVLTGSRGGWIGIAFALMLWPLLSGGSLMGKIWGALIVLGVTVAGLWAVYQGSEYARMRIDPFLEGKFEASRPLIWKAGWQMWQDVPWFGRGAAAYNVYFDQFRPHGFLNNPHWAHNDYLNTLVDYGLVGFALWLAAGATIGWGGWQAVLRARREKVSAENLFAMAKWKLGLLLGLVAYVIHLGVDFHTKIPALAFAAAMVAALLIRDEPRWWKPLNGRLAGLAGLFLVTVIALVVWRIASPLYRAEALREEARRRIERYARTGEGDRAMIASEVKTALTKAVRIDSGNGQAWADLSYANAQSWVPGKGDLVSLGRFAELAAEEALLRCALNAEFWIRKAVALDIQRGRTETESCYRRALGLAPNSPSWWYHYAYHLQAFPARRDDALRALETCLTLDPSHGPAKTLRQQFTTNR